MSWLWSQPPSEDEAQSPSSDPYAPSSFDSPLNTSTDASANADPFGSAFTADVDLSPPKQSTSSETESRYSSSSSSAPSSSSFDFTTPPPSSFGADPISSSDQQDPPSINFSTLGRINPSVISTNPGFQTQPSVDYVFADDYKDVRKKSSTEQLTYLTGGSYLLGSLAGASMGMAQAIPESAGKPARLRVNAILNAVAKRGTNLGNACGVLALAFSLSESALYNYTQDETIFNYAAAGAISGALFKSTRGIRPAATWGLAGACLALGTVYASRRGYYGRGLQGAL